MSVGSASTGQHSLYHSSIFDELRRAQAYNHRARVTKWKTRIHADRDDQRSLIIHNLSQRLFKASLNEVTERRVAGGEVRHKMSGSKHEGFIGVGGALIIVPSQQPFRPDSAPASTQPGKLSRQSSWFRFMPPRPQTAEGSGMGRRRLESQSEGAKTTSEKRQKFLETISTSFNQEQSAIEHGLQSQLSLQARDAKFAYASLTQSLPGAQVVKLIGESAHSVQKERQRIVHEEKKRSVSAPPDKRPPNKGLAILLDPSLDTRGKIVTLYVKFDDGTGSSSSSPLPSARSRPSSRANSRPSSPSQSRRPTSSPSPPRFPSSDSLPIVRAASVQSLASATSPKSGQRTQRSSRSPPRSRKSIREKVYKLRSHARFDLSLTTTTTSVTNSTSPSFSVPYAAAASIEDKAQQVQIQVQSKESRGSSNSNSHDYDSLVDDYLDTYLPGWDGVQPIYVPGNVCVCHIEVRDATETGDEGEMMLNGLESEESWRQYPSSQDEATQGATRTNSSSGSSSSSPSRRNLPRPVSAAAYAFSKREEERKANVVVASVCVFPCRSQGHAVTLIRQHMNECFRKKTANVTVPGGAPALTIAAFHGNLTAVIKLVENGASLNLKSATFPQNTALHDAVLGGHEDVVNYLLSKGAKQTIADESGNLPIHTAALQNNVRIARILMKAEGAAAALARRNAKGLLALELSSTALMASALETGMRGFGISSKRR